MRRRRRIEEEDDAEVALSPLIDCVFLLLIFFLVTTMLKRKEMLIPITLPDASSAVATETHDETIIIGLDKAGGAYRMAGREQGEGAIRYARVEDLVSYLNQLIQEQGQDVLNRPLRIDADRDTPFQVAVDTVDICKLQGFNNVGLRTREMKE